MADVIQRNFAGGELSPGLYPRADQVKYSTGCRTALNFFVRKSGGLANRPGFRFITEAVFLGIDKDVRLQKFVFSDDQAYVLVHTGTMFRVIKNGALVVMGASTAWDNLSTYNSGVAVLYAGVFYISMFDMNIGNQPDASPTWWHPLTNQTFKYYEQRHNIPGPGLKYLRWQQSGDLVFNVIRAGYNFNGGAAARVWRRNADNVWGQVAENFGPKQVAPTAVVLNGTAGTPTQGDLDYVVVAISATTGEYSVASAPGQSNAISDPAIATPVTVSWSAATGAASYDVYRKLYGRYGFVGSTDTTSFVDYGVNPNVAQTPAELDGLGGPSSWSQGVPSVVAFVQQRLVLAATTGLPEKIWMSAIGRYYNFLASSPPSDDDMVSFTLAGLKVSQVRAIVEVGNPVIFTQSGEWVLLGDADGAITPSTITPRQMAYNGINEFVPPVVVDDTVLYAQARGSIVRDLKYKVDAEGYEGRDLTVFSSHIFKDKTIKAMDYASVPNPLVWCVLSDGTLASLSYLREHSIWGWTRHQTDGVVLDCCVIPEGDEDVLYIAVKRNINGVDKYYIERMEYREDTVLEDCFYVDSGLTYDGTNAGAVTVTMVGQGSMTVNDWFTLTASAPPMFVPDDVGNAVVLTSGTSKITLHIREYISNVSAKVQPERDLTGPDADPVFAALINVPTTSWGKAVDEFLNLDHLEGKTVAILADGVVVSNGVDAPLFTVTTGVVTIPTPAVKVHIGLPYTADFESLDVDTRDQPLRQRTKMPTHVGVMVEKTSAIKAGSTFSNIVDVKISEDGEGYESPTPLKTGYFDVSVASGWDEESRVCIRQDNPLPATIGGIIPRYLIGG